MQLKFLEKIRAQVIVFLKSLDSLKLTMIVTEYDQKMMKVITVLGQSNRRLNN